MNFILFSFSILIGSIGAIFLKIGSAGLVKFEFSFKWFLNIILNGYLDFGFLLYFSAAIIWIYLMTKYPLSFVQPILALTYVITPILALTILKEPVPLLRWIGIFIIIIGVTLISKT